MKYFNIKEYIYIHLKSNRYFLYIIFCSIIVVFGISLIFSNIFFYSFSCDECYQALSVRQYQDSPAAIGVFYIGHIFTSIFGDSIICLRTISKFAYLLAIGIPCIYLNRHTKNILLSSLVFLICAACATIGGFNIFNWDTIAYPFEAIGLIYIINYISSPKKSNILWCGILCGIMTIIRLPLFAATIICLVSIILCNKGNIHRIILHSVIGLFACIITILLCGSIISGSVTNYFLAFSEDNIINGHGIDNLHRNIWRFNHLMPYIFISGFGATFSFILAWIYSKLNFHSKIFFVLSVFCTIIIYWFIVRLAAIQYGYDTTIFGMPYPFAFISILIIPAYNCFKCPQTISKKLKIELLIILMFYLLEGFGSDTPYERLNISFIFPITLSIIWSALQLNLKHVFKIWIYISSLTLPFICIAKVAFIAKYYTLPQYTPNHFEHLLFPIAEIDIWKNLHQDVEMIKLDDPLLNNTIFWGYEKYTPTYCFMDKPKVSIQTFHMKDGDIDFFKSLIHKPLYIILMSNGPSDLQRKTMNILINDENYRLFKKRDHYSILQYNN